MLSLLHLRLPRFGRLFLHLSMFQTVYKSLNSLNLSKSDGCLDFVSSAPIFVASSSSNTSFQVLFERCTFHNQPFILALVVLVKIRCVSNVINSRLLLVLYLHPIFPSFEAPETRPLSCDYAVICLRGRGSRICCQHCILFLESSNISLGSGDITQSFFVYSYFIYTAPSCTFKGI